MSGSTALEWKSDSEPTHSRAAAPAILQLRQRRNLDRAATCRSRWQGRVNMLRLDRICGLIRCR